MTGSCLCTQRTVAGNGHVNTTQSDVGGCQIRPWVPIRPCLHYCMWSVFRGHRQNLGCVVALAVSSSGFHSGHGLNLLYRLNCYVDKQPVVGDLFFAEL